METRTARDLKNITREAKNAVRDSAYELAQLTRAAREAALQTAESAYHVAQDKTVAACKATDACIRDHPYSAVGAAFGIGVILGILVGRR